MLLLLGQMIERKLTPSILSRGNGILNMAVNDLNINFNDTYLYIKASLAKCCKLYEIPMLKGTFPHQANRSDFFSCTKIPPFKLFVNEGDGKKDIEEKKKWYESRRKKPWLFKTEISIKIFAIK